jgi:hypothetical protein
MVRHLIVEPNDDEVVKLMIAKDINFEQESSFENVFERLFYYTRRFLEKNYDSFDEIILSKSSKFDYEFFENLVLYFSMLVGFIFMFLIAYAGLKLHCGEDK